MPLKRYSKKEPQVFLWIILPYIIFFNGLIFGSCIFSSISVFARALAFSGIYLFLLYFIFGMAATGIQKRFPGAGDMFRRIAVLLPMFYVMNAISFSGLIYLYKELPLLPCTPKPGMFLWAILYACLMSTIITFLNEGVANWEAWKSSLTETERMKNVYQRSKLLCLREQINPHFLFNCFNTLSGLIQEDQSKAEAFLDEMTKVHRYILRSSDQFLVSLEMEMKFANSYLFLAEERFGEAIQTTIQIEKDALEKQLPPLSMQVILENIIHNNALSKTDPLKIHITSTDHNHLAITNTIHKKNITVNIEDDGFENLVKKYEILNAEQILIHEEEGERSLLLPLFDKKESAL
ncbi:MAG TPA: histidine kinase [Chitinophagaceae bacterium]|nr:histidine kinase [Chitinophagaceae bacterium]